MRWKTLFVSRWMDWQEIEPRRWVLLGHPVEVVWRRHVGWLLVHNGAPVGVFPSCRRAMERAGHVVLARRGPWTGKRPCSSSCWL